PARTVRPATAEGTQNPAAPWYGSILTLPFAAKYSPSWPVKSYMTTDQNGTPMVVNVTGPGHPLYPGVVMRYVTASPTGSTIQNEGAGAAWPQGPRSWVPGSIRNWANDHVWRGQSEDLIKGIRRHWPMGMGKP